MLYDTKWDTEVIAPWRRILFDAATYIERYGWCQRELERDDGAVCIVGALNRVLRDSAGQYWNAIGKATRYLGADSLTRWNDAPGRTKQQVVAALRDAAAQDVP